MPANPAGDGECETFLMFQIASPASWSPAFRPTRGSGDGAAMSGADMSGMRDGVGPPDIDEDDVEQAAMMPAMDMSPTTAVAESRN